MSIYNVNVHGTYICIYTVKWRPRSPLYSLYIGNHVTYTCRVPYYIYIAGRHITIYMQYVYIVTWLPIYIVMWRPRAGATLQYISLKSTRSPYNWDPRSTIRANITCPPGVAWLQVGGATLHVRNSGAELQAIWVYIYIHIYIVATFTLSIL